MSDGTRWRMPVGHFQHGITQPVESAGVSFTMIWMIWVELWSFVVTYTLIDLELCELRVLSIYRNLPPFALPIFFIKMLVFMCWCNYFINCTALTRRTFSSPKYSRCHLAAWALLRTYSHGQGKKWVRMGKKVCYKVSLCENCQRWSCKAFTGVSIHAKMVRVGLWDVTYYVKIWLQTVQPCSKTPISSQYSLVVPWP